MCDEGFNNSKTNYIMFTDRVFYKPA